MSVELSKEELENMKLVSADFLPEYVNILLSGRYNRGKIDGINWAKDEL